MHISFNIFPDSDFLEERSAGTGDELKSAAAGIMEHIREITLFTNSTVNSYERLGEFTAPRDILWASDEGLTAYQNEP